MIAEPTRPAARERAIARPGTELAPGYRVIGHLNRGNRLDVYDGWSDERDSRCVLKTLRPDRAHERPAVRALRQEATLLLQATHPHLVRAYELTAAPGGPPVLVLETLGGETLSHLIARLADADRRLPGLDVALLGRQLASVLAYLHGRGWLHLDLKPSNIVVEAGRARLIDLSIARRPGRARPGTGTYEYLSPEQARGGLLTSACDVWGLGAVLFAALTAEPPYDADSGPDDETGDPTDAEPTDATLPTTSLTGPDQTRSGVPYPQLLGDPQRVRSRRRMPPALADLADLIDTCLRHDPAARPTLAEAARRLDAMAASADGRRGSH